MSEGPRDGNDTPAGSDGDWNYYTYKFHTFTCKRCGWTGLGESMDVGDGYRGAFEALCPECKELVTFVPFPTIAEARASWQHLTEKQKRSIEEREARQQAFEAVCLKSPDQLPDIDEPHFTLTWDQDAGNTLILLGKREIFREPAVWDGSERFEEVAEILNRKYGKALRDLVPAEAALMYLWGDSYAGKYIIERCRSTLFKGRRLP